MPSLSVKKNDKSKKYIEVYEVFKVKIEVQRRNIS
jgi:hypothetical protein